MAEKWGNPSGDVHELLGPTYECWKFLLESIIQQKTLYDLEQELPLEEITSDDVNTVLSHYVGYLVCVAIGVVILLAVWIGGPIYCCCGCCCCNEKTMKVKTRRMSCCTMLFMASFLLMVGAALMGCTIMLTGLVSVNSEVKGGGVEDNMQQGLQHVEDFLLYSVDQMEMKVHDEIDGASNKTDSYIQDIPDRTKRGIEHTTGALTLLKDMDIFLRDINESSSILDDYLKQIIHHTEQLDIGLEEVRKELCDYLTCDEPICEIGILTTPAAITLATSAAPTTETPCYQEMCRLIPSINISDSFTPGDLADFSEHIRLAEAGIEMVENGSAVIDDIADLLMREAESNSEQFREPTADIKVELNQTFESIRDVIHDINVGGIVEDWQEMQEDFTKYWDIAFSAALVLVILAFFSPIMFCTGCCYSVCGGTDRKVRPRSACMLRAGVWIGLIVCVLFPLVAAALLVAGGLVHTEFCRYMHDPVTHEPSINVIDSIIVNRTAIEFDFVSGVLQCEDNVTIYMALDMDSIEDFNINHHLDTSALEDSLKNFSQSTTVDDVEWKLLADTNILIQLHTVLDTTNYADYVDVMTSNVTKGDLGEIATILSDCDPNLSNISLNLNKLNTIVEDIEKLQKDFLVELYHLSNISDAYNIEENVQAIEKSESFLTANFSHIESLVMSNVSMDGLQAVEDAVHNINMSIRTDVANCYPLFDSVYTGIEYACVDILYPLNAYWFGMGWFIVFFFVCSFMACCLSAKFLAQYDSGQAKKKYLAEGTDAQYKK